MVCPSLSLQRGGGAGGGAGGGGGVWRRQLTKRRRQWSSIYAYFFHPKRLFLIVSVLFVIWDLSQPDDEYNNFIYNQQLMINVNDRWSNSSQKCHGCGHLSLFDGFVGSPNSTMIRIGKTNDKLHSSKDNNNNNNNNNDGCFCELLSIDCLDTIRCLPDNMWEHIRNAIHLRSLMKRRASIWHVPLIVFDEKPVGMTTQFISISVFRYWLQHNELPLGHPNHDDMFLNASHNDYHQQDCVVRNLKGRHCFLEDFSEASEETYGELELEAVRQYPNHHHTSSHNNNEDNNDKDVAWMQRLQSHPLEATPLQYLIAFCLVSRITFTPRPHVLRLYEQRLATIDHQSTVDSEEHKPILRVSLHARRGDACRHETDGFETQASPLHSPFQTSSNRKCYATTVYLDALRRIVQLKGQSHHIVVYLATDHSQSLTEEIERDHTDLFHRVSWKFLNYSRSIFNYFEGRLSEFRGEYFIESDGNHLKHVLGESALLDIHHLSHGSVFLGHLGSRFGKVAWWQAVGRHAAFVPFFTVDGHTTCCDIDESCGNVAPSVVSMENCLGIFYPLNSDYFDPNEEEENGNATTVSSSEEYWKHGAMYRPVFARAERKWRMGR